MIPAEAVEALMDAANDSGFVLKRSLAHDWLEAAAPYLMAESFEQGQKSGMRHVDRLIAAAKIGRPELPGPISPNPYRPTA